MTQRVLGCDSECDSEDAGMRFRGYWDATQNVTQRVLGCDSECDSEDTEMRFRGYWDVTQRVLGCDPEDTGM